MVSRVRLSHDTYVVVFTVGHRHFRVSDEGDKQHATFMERMFNQALTELGVKP